jgi:uncharacterized protein YjeT (DUF2065 family)
MVLTFIIFVVGLIIAVGGLYVVLNDKEINKMITALDMVKVVRLSGVVITIIGVMMMFMRCI